MCDEVLLKAKKKKNKFIKEDDEGVQNHSKKKKYSIKKEEILSPEIDSDAPASEMQSERLPSSQIAAMRPEWSKEDSLELIRRMELQLPKVDTKSFTNRIEKLNWDQIQFRNHSVENCYEQWKVLRTKVRHYRLLGEVLSDVKTWVENPWASTSKGKKTRHPEMPPRPLSSFMLFYMDKKNKIIRRHPEMRLTEISRLIGEKYKKLSAGKKSYYVEKAKLMQEEYKENVKKFYEKHPEFVKPVNKKDAGSNRPLPPIKMYINDKLQKHQNDEYFNKHDCVEKYKELWKTLSFKKKAYWIRIAKEEEDKYLEHQNEDMLMNGVDKPATTYKSVISKDERTILDRLAGKPEKPPNSAYSLFSRLMLQDKDQDYIDGEPKNRMKEIANKWKDLPIDQKKEYAERVIHMHEEYKLDFANYLDSLPEEKKAEELAKLQPKKKAAKLNSKKLKKATKLSDSQKEQLFKNEPEKPPVTAWDLYKNEFIKKNSHLPKKAAYKQAAAMWKTLPKKTLDKYKKKHEQLKIKYMTDYEAFLTTLNEDELKEYSALKTAKSGEDLGEDSMEEEEESSDDQDEGNSSESSSESSEDSGVSEED